MEEEDKRSRLPPPYVESHWVGVFARITSTYGLLAALPHSLDSLLFLASSQLHLAMQLAFIGAQMSLAPVLPVLIVGGWWWDGRTTSSGVEEVLNGGRG